MGDWGFIEEIYIKNSKVGRIERDKDACQGLFGDAGARCIFSNSKLNLEIQDRIGIFAGILYNIIE